MIEKKENQLDERLATTEQKSRELESAQARLDELIAEEMDKTKTDLLQLISHETRTPLNGVLGFAKILQETKITQEQKGHLKNIIQSGNKLLAFFDKALPAGYPDYLNNVSVKTGHPLVRPCPFLWPQGCFDQYYQADYQIPKYASRKPGSVYQSG